MAETDARLCPVCRSTWIGPPNACYYTAQHAEVIADLKARGWKR